MIQAYRLSKGTFTPISYWLDMTWNELQDWICVINADQKGDE